MSRLTETIIGAFAGFLLKTVHSTIKWEVAGNKEELIKLYSKEPIIIAFWHGEQLCTPACWPRIFKHTPYEGYTLISKHKDGRIAAKAIESFGIKNIPGSSSYGGREALKLLVKTLENSHAIITPDGPRGPIYKVKGGVIRMAQLSGRKIIPLAAYTSSYWTFKSWDKMKFPKPFSKGKIGFGDPIDIPRKLTMEEWNSKREEVESAINELSSRIKDSL